MADPKTIKIKSSHESQGPFVLINEEDFNADVHERYDEAGDDAAAAAWKAEKARLEDEAKVAAEKAAKEQAEADAANAEAVEAKAKAVKKSKASG